LVLGGADLRLNPARVTSDVGELEALLASGETERAVALYRGPFLDGFFLSGAADFEQWTTTQRGRYEGIAARALEQLATATDRQGDARRAMELWQRLAALRPLDARIATRLMTAMVAAGDRAGALRHARVHEELLRNEAGLPPDESVARLANELREATPTAHRGIAPPARRPVAAPPQSPAPVADTEGPQPSRRRAWRAPLIASAITFGLTASVLVISNGNRSDNEAAVAPARRVVVMPFRVSGASPELRHLREGVVELLSTRMSDDSLGLAVDAGAVLGAWRASGLSVRGDATREESISLARQVAAGVSQVVVGSLVGSRERVIASASLVRANGATIGEATAEGPADSISRVMDRLATRLLLVQAGEDPQVIGRVTESLPALRAYLLGQASFQRRGYRAAMNAFDRALRHDSSFARAALRLAWVADRISETEMTHRGIALAWASRAHLTERDAALLRVFAGPRYPAPSTGDELLLAWRRPVDAAPRVATGWIALGARSLRDGPAADPDGSDERARTAFARAIALDPRNTSLAELMVLLTQHRPALQPPDSAVRAMALGDSLSPFAPFLRWRDAAVRGDSGALRRIRGQLGQMRVSTLRLIAMASLYDGISPDDGERAVALLLERATDDLARVDALEALHGLFMNQGRQRDALDVTHRLASVQPGLHAHLRLRVLDAMYAGGDTVAANAAARELARVAGVAVDKSPLPTASWLADRCVLAQWRLRQGDTAGVRATIAALEHQRFGTARPRIAASPVACAELLQAALAVTARRADAAAQLARVSEIAFTPATAGDAAVYAPLLLSQLHERLGDRAGALRAIRRRPYMSGWPRYNATIRREEARLSVTGP
jgi:tetratricopeptide (TPR) repeat protein